MRCPCCETKLALVKKVEGKWFRLTIPEAELKPDDN
jgi:hypothetical protein